MGVVPTCLDVSSHAKSTAVVGKADYVGVLSHPTKERFRDNVPYGR